MKILCFYQSGKITFLLFLIGVYSNTFSQTNKYCLEINPFIRYDHYKEFVGWETGIGGKHYVKPSGISYGINFNLKRRINSKNSLYFGGGYYRHIISKIESHSNLGEAKQRLINYPSPLLILFYSDRYAYNTLTANIGYERNIKIQKNYSLTTGIELNELFTFSQFYHLSYNPGGSRDYRKNNFHFLGWFAGIDIGLIKDYKQFSVGPRIKLPVFSHLRTDSTFPNETNSGYRNQLFSGIGLGLSFTYKLKF